MSHRLPSANLLMGAAFYEHEHRDNHVLNICNSVKEWIRNTSNVFSPCPIKPVIKKKKKKKMNLVLKKERIFLKLLCTCSSNMHPRDPAILGKMGLKDILDTLW